MRKRKFKLFSKVFLFYLLFTLVFFILSGMLLKHEANKVMHNIMEIRFRRKEHHIQRFLKENPKKALSASYFQIEKVKSIPEGNYPVYTDTVILNEQTQHKILHRKKTSYITVDGNHYKYEITKDADELYQFKEDIFNIVLLVFGILAFFMVVVNYAMSGILFEPFKKILRQMSDYKIGKKSEPIPVHTSTLEFHQLIVLFESMKNRIEEDYHQLKEYTENMSHELQTPLSILQNKTEALLSGNSLSRTQMNKLKSIYEEISRLSKLGSTLNLITKIENNEFKNIQETFTKKNIEIHIHKIEDIANMKKLKIITDLNGSHSFTIDPGLLDILLLNLIKNAIYHSDENSEVFISSTNKKLQITNQGKELGFPSNEIFNRYKKGTGKKSLGLGLAIVKKICQVNDLDIRYDFIEGKHTFNIEPISDQST